jgi:2',3'-cyclic-nucleotide 2'-phosphodiesterase (5'-nucleotidase family)
MADNYPKSHIAAAFLLILALTLSCEAPGVDRASEEDPIREVTILYTNDFESAWDPIPAFWRDDVELVGGIAQLATLVDRRRADGGPVFLFDAGDIFTGTLSKLTRGELPFELMITMGYDAMCIGNHEFEYGWQVLREAMQRAPFPVLAANLYYQGSDIPFTQRYAIIERAGFRIGVIGIFGQDAATALYPPHLAGLEARDPAAAVRELVPKLRPDVDLLLLLTHQGHTAPMQTDDEADVAVHRDIEADIRLAGVVPGVDVLIGGHADAGQETPVVHPETGTLITQTYGQGTRLGYLELRVDTAAKRVVEHEGRLLLVDSDVLPPHPRVAAKLAAYRSRHPEISEVIGSSSERITRRYVEESDMGNLFADILRDHGGTQIGLIHAGGLRADLPAGDVTREDLLDAWPFLDLVYELEMTGAQLRQVLEESLSLERGLIQVSGLDLRYSMSQPVGRRLVEVRVGDEPLDPAASYSVTTVDFLAHAADLFSGFEGATIVDDAGPEFAELLEAHFGANEVVEIPPRGRQQPVR